jgi:ABC-2 type transport system ATP-binding protein
VFGQRRVVADVSFEAVAGSVTGFVGANGAGKTTTIRMLLGLIEPAEGQTLITGRRYRELDRPRHTVGAVLDVPGAHPGHSGRAHLEIVAEVARLPRRRVEEMLDLVGLSEHGGRRVGAYSLGMRQRLALATALLADPPVLVLDEPSKGLDPPGIRWLHSLLRARADAGGCVLISSHHLAELEAIADHVVIISGGRIVADAPIGELLAGSGGVVSVRCQWPERLVELLRRDGIDVSERANGDLIVRGVRAERVGRLASAAGIALERLAEQRLELEDVFFELTAAEEEERLASDRQE